MATNNPISSNFINPRSPRKRDLWLPVSVFEKNSSVKRQRINLYDLIEEIIKEGNDQCCTTCACGYDTTGVTFASTVTVKSVVVDGVTITIDLSADNWSEVADILSNLGFGKFTVTVNSSDTVDGGICVPANSHTFGDLTIDDGTAYDVVLELICPLVISD